MKKIITSLSLFFVGMLAQAQTAEIRKVSSFTRIEIDGNIELVYTETAAPSIRAVASEHGKLDNVITEINEGTLRIYVKDHSNQKNQMAKIFVTGNGVSSITAESDAKVSVKNQLSAPEVSITLNSGASFLGVIKSEKSVTLRAEKGTVVNVRAETANFYGNFSSNAKVNLSGTAATALIKSCDAAFCLAKNFDAKRMIAKADDFAKVLVYANDSLDISVAEMAKVTYVGNPKSVTMNENAIATENGSLKTASAIAGN